MQMRALRRLILVLCALAAVLPARAQFYLSGTDPGGLRWSSVETDSYRVIYPQGLDSLGRVYARELERSRAAVAGSIGMVPNEGYRRKLPVILHAWSAQSNGIVTWTPRRMELLPTPDAYDPEPTVWVRQLTVHESRHVAQMQLGHQPRYKWLNILAGQLWPGAAAAVYSGPAWLEGDAVVAETALTAAGRGRTGDFLEYYRASFLDGQLRDYWRWYYGSQRLYTPDHYRIGYLTIAGVRTFYDAPDFTARYYARIVEKGFPFFNLQKTVREYSGMGFSDSWRALAEATRDRWAAETAARAPFTPLTQISRDSRRYTSFGSQGILDGGHYAVLGGITRATRLVRLDTDGRIRRAFPFAASTSRLAADPAGTRLYWTEFRSDPRWEQRSWSDVRYFDGERSRSLTRGGRYFNPAPSGGRIAVTEYPVEGGSALVFLDASDGSVLERLPAPAELQIVESTESDGRWYVSAMSEGGFGIYRLPAFEAVLDPQQVKIKQLRARQGQLLFVSDRSGVDELYSLDPASREVRQWTVSRTGVRNFLIDRDTLFVTAQQVDGRKLYAVPLASLSPREVRFDSLYRDPVAERLAAQEPVALSDAAEAAVSAPVPYRKAAHLLHFHSWAPVYFNYNAVDNMSFATIGQEAGLGATAFFQNELGSAYGFVAASAWTPTGGWRPQLHAGLTYAGWYPVIEAKLDWNESRAVNYALQNKKVTPTVADYPELLLDLNLYIPWAWSLGGWRYGVIPQIRYHFSNDKMDDGGLRPIQDLSVGTRAYIMRPIASSGIYPRWGLGVEARFRSYPGLARMLQSTAVASAYAYTPGLLDTHGFKWAGIVEWGVGDGALVRPYATVAPRGLTGAALHAMIATYPVRSRFSVDYAFPFGALDASWLCPVAYLRNFEMILHYDLCGLAGSDKRPNGNLTSAGADLMLRLGNLLWVPYDTRIGVTYCYNGGSIYGSLNPAETPVKRHFVGMLFSISL